MTTTIDDKLGGLHVVVALTQDSINFQIAQLHRHGHIRPRLALAPADTGVEIDAELAAPTVHFAIPGKPRTAVLVLRLPTGKLTYWEGFGPSAKPHTIEIADWRLGFRVDLDFQAIAADHLRAGAPIPAEVKAQLEHFATDMFTIRRLFLNFENADLTELDPTRTKMPLPGGAAPTPGLILHVQRVLAAYVASLRGTANPYILGYAIEPKPTAPVDGPLAATSGTYSTFTDPKADGMNALNFLLMTNREALPTAPTTGVFATNWARGNLDGRLVIGGHRFWEGCFLPRLEADLGPPTATSGGWTFFKRDSHKGTIPGFGHVAGFPIDVTITNSFENTAAITCANGGPETIAVTLSGTFVARRQYEAHPLGIYEMFAEIATITWLATITVTAGANGQLAVESKLTTDAPVYSTDGNWIGRMDAGIPSNRSLLEKDGTDLTKRMTAMLGRIALGQIVHRIVMPTGSTMFLKNAQLDAARNVLVDIAYASAT